MAGHCFDKETGNCHVCGTNKSDATQETADTGGHGENDRRRSSSSNCFIATAVYGDTMAPQVISLRAFRDDVLEKTHWGRAFIATYYSLSPPIANWLKTKPWLSGMVRQALDRLVTRITK